MSDTHQRHPEHNSGTPSVIKREETFQHLKKIYV